jgi:hypothetical protein
MRKVAALVGFGLILLNFTTHADQLYLWINDSVPSGAPSVPSASLVISDGQYQNAIAHPGNFLWAASFEFAASYDDPVPLAPGFAPIGPQTFSRSDVRFQQALADLDAAGEVTDIYWILPPGTEDARGGVVANRFLSRLPNPVEVMSVFLGANSIAATSDLFIEGSVVEHHYVFGGHWEHVADPPSGTVLLVIAMICIAGYWRPSRQSNAPLWERV